MSQTFHSGRTLQASSIPQYLLLMLVSVIGLSYAGVGGFYSLGNLLHGTEIVELPFNNGSLAHIIRLTPTQAQIAGVPTGFSLDTITYVSPEAKAAGLDRGDAVETIAGRPFEGNRDLYDAIEHKHPGDPLEVTVWHQGTSLDQPPVRATIVLAPQRNQPAGLQDWFIHTLLDVLSIFCLLTGLYVVFARPRSPNAWLILGMLAYFHAIFLNPGQHGPTLVHMSFLWNSLVQSAMPVCFMLFGVYFPERSEIDRRRPWIKWTLIGPAIVLYLMDSLADYVSMFHFSLAASFQQDRVLLNNVENVWGAICISYGFACFYAKEGHHAITPDARRRLRVLIAGCSVGLIPFFLLLLYSLIRGIDVGTGVAGWVWLSVLIILFAFPLTLAYVVIVQRAMDLRILLRQGTK